MQTLMFKPEGPLVQYQHDTLIIEDLNPEFKTRWRLSPTELMMFGWCCIWAAWLHLIPGRQSGASKR